MSTDVALPAHAQRYADPRSQVLVSAVVLGAAAAVHAFVVYRIVLAIDPPIEVGMWLAPALWMCPSAVAVAIRARTGARRRRALAVVGLALLFSFAGPVVLGPSLVVERYGDLYWLVDAAAKVSTLLLVAAWGIARRHGGWWWIGLPVALALLVAAPDLQVLLLDLLPGEWWQVSWYVLSWGPPLLGGCACWLVDVLTTRPVPPRGTLVA